RHVGDRLAHPGDDEAHPEQEDRREGQGEEHGSRVAQEEPGLGGGERAQAAPCGCGGGGGGRGGGHAAAPSGLRWPVSSRKTSSRLRRRVVMSSGTMSCRASSRTTAGSTVRVPVTSISRPRWT